MTDLIVFGMPLKDFIVLVLEIAPVFGILGAVFITWGQRHWKGMNDELDALAGPADEPGDVGFWEMFWRSFKSTWRRDLWLPLAVLRALFRRGKN